MFFKNYENEKGASFPEKWQNNTNISFEEVFQKKFKLENQVFQNYGFMHKDEILMITSLVSKSTTVSPITLFLSKTLEEKDMQPKKIEKVKNTLIDINGIIFNEILQNKDDFSYQVFWQDYEFKKEKYHYKTTRENIDLSIQASQLLEGELKD